MRYLLLVILLGLNPALMLQAAEKTANLAGSWFFEPDKSEFDYSPPGRRKIDLQIGMGGTTVQRKPNERKVNNEESVSEIAAEARIKNLIVKIDQTDSEIQVLRQFTLDGEREKVLQIFSLNGDRCVNPSSYGSGDAVSRVRWEKRKLINTGTETEGSGIFKTEFSLEEEYSLSKRGKRLTIKTRKISTKGIVKIKQVFRKQEPVTSGQ